MEYPNKIFIVEYTKSNNLKGLIVFAAKDSLTVKDFVQKEFNIQANPVWLMGACYEKMYNQSGSVLINPQIRILYSS